MKEQLVYKCRRCHENKVRRAFLKEWYPECRKCMKLLSEFYQSALKRDLIKSLKTK